MTGPAWLAKRLYDRAIVHGDFVLRSGERSDWYFDKYLAWSNPLLCLQAGTELANLVSKQGSEMAPWVAGPELGGCILASAIGHANPSLYSRILFVRGKSKNYGTEQRVEGLSDDDDPSQQRVTLVEDVVTTGESVADAANALRKAGVTITAVASVLDRSDGETTPHQIRQEAQAPYYSLFTPGSLGVR